MSYLCKNFVVKPSDSTSTDNDIAIGLVQTESVENERKQFACWLDIQKGMSFYTSANSCHAPSLVMFLLEKSDILHIVFGDCDVNNTNHTEIASEYVHSWEATTLAPILEALYEDNHFVLQEI